MYVVSWCVLFRYCLDVCGLLVRDVQVLSWCMWSPGACCSGIVLMYVVSWCVLFRYCLDVCGLLVHAVQVLSWCMWSPSVCCSGIILVLFDPDTILICVCARVRVCARERDRPILFSIHPVVGSRTYEAHITTSCPADPQIILITLAGVQMTPIRRRHL